MYRLPKAVSLGGDECKHTAVHDDGMKYEILPVQYQSIWEPLTIDNRKSIKST